MKKIAFMLLAATLCFAACRKQQTDTPVPATHITEADFKGSKATIAGLRYKKSDEGLELDYDLVVKEVSANKYEAAIKINGVKLNGKKMSGYKSSAIFGAVLGINTTKESKEVPLDVVLKSDGGDKDKIITFPAFEYKGDLGYELLNVTTSITINSGNFVMHDDAHFRLFDEDMSVKNGGLKTDNGTVIFTQDIDPIFIGKSTIVADFSLLLKDGKPVMEDKTTVFVLPNGHTVTQAPELAKVTIEEEKDGTYGYVTLTITGDPARYINTVYYQPCTADGTTKDPKDEPILKFEATHFNEQNGVQRFRSTHKYGALYHRERAKFHRGCMQYWHGSTRVDVIPDGRITYVKD